jgi:hypothetical protein
MTGLICDRARAKRNLRPLERLVEVFALQQAEAPELLLGLRERTVRHEALALTVQTIAFAAELFASGSPAISAPLSAASSSNAL